MHETGRGYLALCAIAKNETLFIREWIAYHYLIGFEKIIIYDNESSPPVRELVGDFFDAGIVDTVFIAGQGLQLTAYNHCLQNYGPFFTWMAFLDVDEFLTLKKERDVRALLADYEDYSGLALNMCSFGSAGHLGRPPGLVIENYRERLNREIFVKSIVRPDKVQMVFSPHDFVYTEGCAVNTDAMPAVGSYAPVAVDKAQVNHYSYRSQQDYEEKISRGDAIYVGLNPRNLDKFVAQTRRKAHKDTAIDAHIPLVKKMLEEGLFFQYFPLDSEALLAASLEQTLLSVGAALREGKPELARLLVKLAYGRFGTETAFLELAVNIFLLSKDAGGAQKAALSLVARSPSLENYGLLFSVFLACGSTAQAEALGAFIIKVASYSKNDDIKQEILRQSEAHGLRLKQL